MVAERLMHWLCHSFACTVSCAFGSLVQLSTSKLESRLQGCVLRGVTALGSQHSLAVSSLMITTASPSCLV